MSLSIPRLPLRAVACLVLGFQTSVSLCHAQLQPAMAQPSANNGVEEPAPVVWEISAAPEAKPALAYSFWPDRSELVSGNTMVPIQRSLVLLLDKSNRKELNQQMSNQWDGWFESSLDQLPKEEIRKYLDEHQSLLSELHRAEFLRDSYYDLGLESMRGLEVITFLLPEIQNMRELSRLLVLETRLALAEDRIDDAIKSIRVNLRLADSAGASGGLIICRLVGMAIANMSLEQVRSTMTHADSPNLYWAIASIPESIMDMQDALEYESTILSRVFPSISNIPAEEIADSAWTDRIVQAASDFGKLNGSSTVPTPEMQIAAGLLVIANADSSRRKLLSNEWNADRVAAMSPAEAVVRAGAISIRRIQDDFGKWARLPRAVRMQTIERLEAMMQSEQFNNGDFLVEDIGRLLGSQLLPATAAALRAELRSEQTIARLATVEAIRDYAAIHGALPKSLQDVTHLPPWNDPVALGPFGYEFISDTEAVFTSVPATPSAPDSKVILRLRK